MRDRSVTESVARQEIKELIWKNWKSLNSEVVGNSAFEKSINNVAFNIARTAQRFYQLGDGYAKPDTDTKDLITKILLEPLT
jgi:isoprene synthase